MTFQHKALLIITWILLLSFFFTFSTLWILYNKTETWLDVKKRFIKARCLWCCKFKMPWKRRNRCEPCVALSCLAGVAEKILSKQKQEESWNSPLRKNISRIPKHFPIIWEAERARARSGWMQDLSSWLKLHRKSLILPRRRSPAVQWQTYSWIQAFWVRTSIYRNVIA